jgi:hypothetical protein
MFSFLSEPAKVGGITTCSFPLYCVRIVKICHQLQESDDGLRVRVTAFVPSRRRKAASGKEIAAHSQCRPTDVVERRMRNLTHP